VINKEGHDLEKGKISILPLKLAGNQALAQDKENVLAQ
jgi:hypothetical protein